MARPEVTAPSGMTESLRAAYRVFGFAAIVHSAFLLVLLLVLQTRNYQDCPWFPYAERFWIGMATLWFFWPIILALHAGITAKRAYLSVGTAAAILVLPSVAYQRVEAPALFMPGDMIVFSPYDLVPYGVAYISGFLDGQRDVRRGRLVLQAYGFGTLTPGVPSLFNFPANYREQGGIEFNHVAGCVVNTWIQAHARSYNRVMLSKIRQRYPALVETAEKEEARSKQSYEDGKRDGYYEAARDIAKGKLFLELTDVREGDPKFEKLLEERYHIGIKRTEPLANFGHASAYNRVAEEEIKRRFGKSAVESIWRSRY